MELQICGMANVDDGRTDLTTEQRMSLLRDRRHRWKAMDWRRQDHWSLREGCPIYEIYGGVFAQMWDVIEYNDELGQDRRVTKLKVIYLSSATRGLEDVMTVVHGDLTHGSFAVHELAIDPDQDLIVLLKYAHSVDEDGRKMLEDR